MKVIVWVLDEYPAGETGPVLTPTPLQIGLPFDFQYKLLQSVLNRLFGEQVEVSYQQAASFEANFGEQQLQPYPAVIVNEEIVLKGQLHIQIIASHLEKLGLTPHFYH